MAELRARTSKEVILQAGGGVREVATLPIPRSNLKVGEGVGE